MLKAGPAASESSGRVGFHTPKGKQESELCSCPSHTLLELP
jgi:hypothetical protein